jgi:hypothetical protein
MATELVPDVVQPKFALPMKSADRLISTDLRCTRLPESSRDASAKEPALSSNFKIPL